jgi:hypothetical protein
MGLDLISSLTHWMLENRFLLISIMVPRPTKLELRQRPRRLVQKPSPLVNPALVVSVLVSARLDL